LLTSTHAPTLQSASAIFSAGSIASGVSNPLRPAPRI
jgi:hypothetical protein